MRKGMKVVGWDIGKMYVFVPNRRIREREFDVKEGYRTAKGRLGGSAQRCGQVGEQADRDRSRFEYI